MPLNLRKSVKIAPGTRLNLSKRGVSASIGGGGLHYSTGKTGCLSLMIAPFVWIFKLYVWLFKGLWWIVKAIWGLFKNPSTRAPTLVVTAALFILTGCVALFSFLADALSGNFPTSTPTVDIANLQTSVVQTVIAQISLTNLPAPAVIGQTDIPETIASTNTTAPIETLASTITLTLIPTQTLFLTSTGTCTPTRAAPTVIIYPTAPLLPTNAPAPACCKHCGANSQPCGDSCISKKYTCHQPPGCACP